MAGLSELRLLYEAGVLSLGDITEKTGYSEDEIRAYAARFKWDRRPPPQGSVRQHLAVIDLEEIKDGVYAGVDAAEMFTPSDLEKSALLTLSSVMTQHKRDFALLRSAAMESITAARRTLTLSDAPVHMDLSPRERAQLIRMASVAVETIKNSTSTLLSVVDAERKHFSLDDVTHVEEENKPESKAEVALRDIQQQLLEMWEQKSAHFNPGEENPDDDREQKRELEAAMRTGGDLLREGT